MARMAELLEEGTGYPGMTGIIPCFVCIDVMYVMAQDRLQRA